MKITDFKLVPDAQAISGSTFSINKPMKLIASTPAIRISTIVGTSQVQSGCNLYKMKSFHFLISLTSYSDLERMYAAQCLQLAGILLASHVRNLNNIIC